MVTKLSLDPLVNQEFEGCYRAERVQNSEEPYIRCLIGWIRKTFDYINRVKLTLPLSVYEGTWTQSPPLVAIHLLDRSCVSVGIFLKLDATFPNILYLSLSYLILASDREGIDNPFIALGASI